MARQPIADEREGVSRFEDFLEIAHILQGLDRAELAGESPARFFVIARRGKRTMDVVGHPILEAADQALAGGGVIGDERRADLVGKNRRVRWKEIAANPGPDRLDRRARNATLLLVRALTV